MRKLTLFAIALSFLGACSQMNESTQEYKSEAYAEAAAAEYDGDATEEAYLESTSTDFKDIVASKAALPLKLDSGKKFIRKSDIEFRTDDVFTTTQRLESLALNHGGWVANSELFARNERTENIQVAKDSMMRVQRYVSVNQLTLRVPSEKLHPVLQELAETVAHLDSRAIRTKDVTFDLLAESLEQKRLAAYQARLSKKADKGSHELEDLTEAENNLLAKQAEQDANKIERLQLNDEIAYSSVTVSIYGSPQTDSYTYFLPESVQPYKQPYGESMSEAFDVGLSGLKYLAFALVAMWPILLGGVIFLIIWKAVRKKKLTKVGA